MTLNLNRTFGYALAIAALCGFVTLGTSCKKEDPAPEQTAQQDDAAKADKKDDAKNADKKDTAKPEANKDNAAAPAAPADEAANEDTPKDTGKYPLFKFTLKYTPENARVGVLYGTSDCKDGTCTIETTSETDPVQINVHAEGYDNKSVTLKEKVENYEINLVKSAPAE